MALRIERFSFPTRPSLSKVKVKVSAAFFSSSLLETRKYLEVKKNSKSTTKIPPKFRFAEKKDKNAASYNALDKNRVHLRKVGNIGTSGTAVRSLSILKEKVTSFDENR